MVRGVFRGVALKIVVIQMPLARRAVAGGFEKNLIVNQLHLLTKNRVVGLNNGLVLIQV